MKSLKHCIKLGCSVKVYVPSTVNITEKAETQEWVDKSLSFLSELFGGATATIAMGAWLAKDGALVKEKVTLVLAYATQAQLEAGIEAVYGFCVLMKEKLGQEAIALEVNGSMYFI